MPVGPAVVRGPVAEPHNAPQLPIATGGINGREHDAANVNDSRWEYVATRSTDQSRTESLAISIKRNSVQIFCKRLLDTFR
jgi:hypothetical protein